MKTKKKSALKRRMLSILLAVAMVFTLAIPAMAADPPAIPANGGTIWIDDVRVEANQPATFTYEVNVADSFDRLNSVGSMLNIPASTTGISVDTPMVVAPGVNAKEFCSTAAKTTGTGLAGLGMGTARKASMDFTVPNVTATTAIGCTLDTETFYVYATGDPDTLVPDDKVNLQIGSIIVQNPVTVKVIVDTGVNGTPKVEAKTTAYDTGKNTYDSKSTTTTTIANGDKIWVDSGTGQQNTPLLNITCPDGSTAQYYTIPTSDPTSGTENVNSYKSAGTDQTLGEITEPTTVYVKFSPAGKEVKVTYDANGGTNPPAEESFYIPKNQTSVDANLADKGNMTYTGNAFIGWTTTKVNGVLAADAADPTTVTKVTLTDDKTVYAVWGVDANGNGVWDKEDAQNVSTYKFEIDAPTTLKTGEEYTTATAKLSADTVKDTGYDNAKLIVKLTESPTGSNPTITGSYDTGLIAVPIDLKDFEINLNLIGGLTKDFEMEIPITMMKADKAGDYTMEFSVVDLNDNNKVICSGTHTVKVSDYVINYELDGGQLAAGTPTGAASNDSITVKPPTKEGFNFTGWTSNDVTVTNGADPMVNDATFTMPEKDVTLTAGWDQVESNVEFVIGTDGVQEAGDTTPLTATVLYGESVTAVPSVTPNTGKLFIGWEDSVNGGIYNDTAIMNYPVKEDTVFTAQYVDSDGTKAVVIFDYDGGKDGEDKGYSVVIGLPGDPITAPDGLTKEDYDRATENDGWDTDLTGVVFGDADSITTYTATWTPSNMVTLTFKTADNTKGQVMDMADGTTLVDQTTSKVEKDSALTAASIAKYAAKSKFKFDGWTVTDAQGQTIGTYASTNALIAAIPKADQDMTMTANFKAQSGGNTGGDTTKKYTLTFEANGGSAVSSITKEEGTVIKLTQTSTRNDYTFEGWYSDKDLKNKVSEVTLNKDMTVYAMWTKKGSGTIDWNKTDHFAYIIGMDDGKVHPEANITRAETATIFFRVMTDATRNSFWNTNNKFSDVNANMWFNNAVSTMANANFIEGYTDGTFGGNNAITRAEFAVIAARAAGADGKYTGATKFSDISGNWAEGYINDAVELGLIEGYTNGTFMPNAKITRAEAMTIVNRFLGRDKVDSSSLMSGMITWPDNTNTGAWYYYDVQEATNSHEFTRQSNNVETWTKITAVRDWAALEKSWSTANSAK